MFEINTAGVPDNSPLGLAASTIKSNPLLVARVEKNENHQDAIVVTHAVSNLEGSIHYDGSKFVMSLPDGRIFSLGSVVNGSAVKTVADHLSASFEKGA
jgi:hypothetical protein